MLLDVLDYVFLLNFPFEATERTFNRFSVLDLHFCQPESTSLPAKYTPSEAKWLWPNMLGYHRWALILGPKADRSQRFREGIQ